jgi:hypothetical protein
MHAGAFCRVEARTVLGPDGDAPHLEGKLVAHYHADPLGATNGTGPRRSGE